MKLYSKFEKNTLRSLLGSSVEVLVTRAPLPFTAEVVAPPR